MRRILRHAATLGPQRRHASYSTMVDLRSDTVTKPTPAMLAAASDAALGDDVLNEDPTVHRLQDVLAERFQKAAALYLPTGTMANLAALSAHGHERGSEMILGCQSHIALYEGGNAASVAGVSTRQLIEDTMTAELSSRDIRDATRQDNDDHYAKTAALCLENTHNMMGGVALPKEYIDDMAALVQELGIRLHIDGARIFNAAVALEVEVGDLCAGADSVSICLSKGLGAPLGSVLVGDAEFIRLAKRARKRLGGGMRQAGVVAAMGLYAVEHHVERLAIDHERARWLAESLQQAGFDLPRGGQVDTNILYFGLPSDCRIHRDAFLEQLRDRGVLLTGGYSTGGRLFRAVTHLDIDDDGIERAIAAMIEVAGL